MFLARAREIRKSSKTNYWRHMVNAWTADRRVRQGRAIRRWRPWEHATGPRTSEGKARSARNADRGGEWRRERELFKMLQQSLREHREALRWLSNPAKVRDSPWREPSRSNRTPSQQ